MLASAETSNGGHQSGNVLKLGSCNVLAVRCHIHTNLIPLLRYMDFQFADMYGPGGHGCSCALNMYRVTND